MKQFDIPIWEKVTIWKTTTITVSAESAEAIMVSVKRGTFYDDYEWDNYHDTDYSFETEEVVDFDYTDVTIDDIEEVV